MDIAEVIATLKSGNWWALAIIVTVYVRHMLSERSTFPWTIPATWLPTVTAGATLALGIEQMRSAGQPWATTALASLGAAVAAGFFDGLIVAIWGKPENAPAWARFAVMLVDDAAPKVPKPPAPPADSPPPGVIAAALIAAAALIGCSRVTFPSSLPSDLEKEYACVLAQIDTGVTAVPAIAKACVGDETTAAIDVIEALLSSPQYRGAHPVQAELLRASVAESRIPGLCR